MCGRCRKQWSVAGNVYCLCHARKEARQRTAKRYQQSRGRSMLKDKPDIAASEIKVTHQGSTASVTVVSAPDRPNVAEQGGKMLVYQTSIRVCDFVVSCAETSTHNPVNRSTAMLSCGPVLQLVIRHCWRRCGTQITAPSKDIKIALPLF